MLRSVAQPEKQAEHHHQSIERCERKNELLAAHPSVIQLGLARFDGRGTANSGRKAEPTKLIRVERVERRFPDSECENAVSNSAEAKSLCRRMVVVDRTRRQLAETTDEPAVPIDLVGVVDALDQHRHLRRFARRGMHVDVAAVPGIANVSRMILRTPGMVSAELLPAAVPLRVVKRRRRVGSVVSEMELPRSPYRGEAFPEAFERKNVCVSTGCRRRRLGCRCRRLRVTARCGTTKHHGADCCSKRMLKHGPAYRENCEVASNSDAGGINLSSGQRKEQIANYCRARLMATTN